MQRLARLTALALLAALVAVPLGAAADRMRIGFHDDPSFRWEPDRTSMLDRAQATNATIVPRGRHVGRRRADAARQRRRTRSTPPTSSTTSTSSSATRSSAAWRC